MLQNSSFFMCVSHFSNETAIATTNWGEKLTPNNLYLFAPSARDEQESFMPQIKIQRVSEKRKMKSNKFLLKYFACKAIQYVFQINNTHTKCLRCRFIYCLLRGISLERLYFSDVCCIFAQPNHRHPFHWL